MKTLSINGDICVDTRQEANRYVEAVIAKLIWRIHHEQVNDVKRAHNTVVYNRGTPPLRYDPSPIAFFDPGSFLVIANHKSICVQYKLGLRYFITTTMLACACIVVACVQGNKRYIMCALIIFAIAVTLTAVISRISQFRKWLKAAIVSGISHVDSE
jgi:hypothetical protein